MNKITTVAIVLAFSTTMCTEDVDHASLARDFVATCLSQKKIYVYNPPAYLNPYKDMSREEMRQFRDRAMRDGSTLFLYRNGLPAILKSQKNFQKHGLYKTWYQNGRVKSEENYADNKLMTGVYFDKSGAVLGKVKQGTGLRIIFGDLSDERRGDICGTARYVDGLKHGARILYRDYAKRIKASEAQYKKGKFHGIKTTWMSTGEKNLEEHYKNGLRHEKSIYWHKNGQVQSTAEYAAGQRTGASVKFYENGVKAEETSKKVHKRWYPSGQLMLQETLVEWGKVSSGTSFDSFGNQNGSVTNEVGSLISCDTSSYFWEHRLAIYRKNMAPRSVQLPKILASCAFSRNDNVVEILALRIKAPPNANLAKYVVSTVLPDDCKSDGPLKFEVADLQAGSSTKLGPVKITLPQPANKWTGKVLVDVQGLVDGHIVRYQYPVLEKRNIASPGATGIK
jgi:antitoxin component YwqK of YwqJK toxin-antitoxin module